MPTGGVILTLRKTGATEPGGGLGKFSAFSLTHPPTPRPAHPPTYLIFWFLTRGVFREVGTGMAKRLVMGVVLLKIFFARIFFGFGTNHLFSLSARA